MIESALIICPEGDPLETVERRLLGLSIGERLLLALEMMGIKRIAFLGEGANPKSNRSKIEIVAKGALSIPKEDSFVLLPADLVFDRQLLASTGDIQQDLPIRHLTSEKLKDVIAYPDQWLNRLGFGTQASGKGFAVRVTDRKSARLATRALLLSLRKPIDGFISRNLNRHISLFCSRWLVGTGIRPNQLTVLIMGMGAVSAVFAAVPEVSLALFWAGLMFQGQSILDGCDGEIARLTYRFSYIGQWLDTIGDDITSYLFCLGLSIGQARMLGLPWLYVAGGVTFVFQLTLSGIMYQRIAKMGTGDLLALPDTLTTGQYKGALGLLLKFFRLITKRDFFVFIIAVITAVGFPLVAFFTMAAGTYIAFIGVVGNELRLRKMDNTKKIV